MPEVSNSQKNDVIFALDIGTRSVIGVVGKAENGRFKVLAMDKQEHTHRSMTDGQIEDIDAVAEVIAAVTKRLEDKLQIKLQRVCVAAAGRALRSQRATFSLEYKDAHRVTDEIVGQLETGAVSQAEAQLQEGPEYGGRFYMVGYTTSQYTLDDYPMSSIKGHSGYRVQAEVVATFLPCAVVESLYAAVERVGLEVSSLTLEPIASLNAAIPKGLRLLNLVLVDIGAGTSDIAICRDGSVVGYTMVTVAGDEITELLMKTLLVDFKTAERLKMALPQEGVLQYDDILGFPQRIQTGDLRELVRPGEEQLAGEIADKILEFNTTAPSAVFLAGGGGKLEGLCACLAKSLGMDPKRVAVAGSHFEESVFSTDYELNDPEYATPLGIGASAALGMIHDSYVVTLNDKPAKLFRSGAFTLRDILLMNGYHYGDMIGRSGANLAVTVDGERLFFRGGATTAAEVKINGREATLYDVVHAGDSIAFTPACPGEDARRTVREVLGEEFEGTVAVNGKAVRLSCPLVSGDSITTERSGLEEPVPARTAIELTLNGSPVKLQPNDSGEPNYLMELLALTGIDFDHLDKPVEITVNNEPGRFSQELHNGDDVIIKCKP